MISFVIKTYIYVGILNSGPSCDNESESRRQDLEQRQDQAARDG